VLITTPESLQAILTGSKMRVALEDVAHVVIDEVHELASAKRGAQLTVGLERLRRVAGPFQRIGLSATVGTPEEVGKFLVGSGKRDPDHPGDREFEIVEVAAGTRTDVRVLDPPITDRDTTLAGELAVDETTASHVRTIREIVADHESTLIFVNTRQTAEALGSRFKTLAEREEKAGSIDDPTEIEVHHGSLSKDVRIDVEDRFKSGELDGLVCTSSMELGIDVGRVDHVVQYGSPREVARLLQRVGRAGHRRDLVSEGTVVTQGGDDTLEALAIARRAGAELVEPAAIHHGSLDTVANQIVGVVMDEGDVHAREAYQIVTRAYPFRDLAEETFQEIVRELDGNHLLWLDEASDTLEKSGGTWQYFYANLSMIPDESTYEVYDMSSRRGIGTLDERFVVNFAGPGETFIQRGEMWRITEVDEEEERVNVTPIADPAGEVPSWIGREIPVPKPVAEEVGRRIRGEAAEALAAGSTPEAVAGDLAERYPADERTIATALKPVVDHVDADHPVPTDRRIVIGERSHRRGQRRLRPRSQRDARAPARGARGPARGLVDRDGRGPVPDRVRGASRRRSRHLPRGVGDDRPRPVGGVPRTRLKNSDALKFTRSRRSPRSSVRSSATARGEAGSAVTACSRRWRERPSTTRRSARCSTPTSRSERRRSCWRTCRTGRSISRSPANARRWGSPADRLGRVPRSRKRRRRRDRDDPRAHPERPGHPLLSPLCRLEANDKGAARPRPAEVPRLRLDARRHVEPVGRGDGHGGPGD